MNVSEPRTENKPVHRSERIWWLAMLPIIFVALIAVATIANEVIASVRISRHVAAVKIAGRPVTERMLIDRFYRDTDHADTIHWSDVSAEVSDLVNRSWNAAIWPVGDWNEFTAKPLDKNDPNLASYEAFLEKAKPLLDRIAVLATDAKPTWSPILSDQSKSWHNAAYGQVYIGGILGLEFNDAVLRREPERAIQALRSQSATSTAYDWRTSIDSDMLRIIGLLAMYQWIDQSLADPIWSDQELQTISKLIDEDQHLGERWRKIIAAEQIAALEACNNGGSISSVINIAANPNQPWDIKSVVVPKTVQWSMLQDHARQLAVGDAGYRGLIQRSRVSQGMSTSAGATLPLGFDLNTGTDWSQKLSEIAQYSGSYAEWLTRLETTRRITLTGLAIKRYELRNHRWPAGLGDLSEEGLTPTNRTNAAGDAFVMQQRDDGKTLVVSEAGVVNPRISLAIGSQPAASVIPLTALNFTIARPQARRFAADELIYSIQKVFRR